MNCLNAPSSVTSINTTNCSMNASLIKTLSQSKYGSLPLKKPSMEVQPKNMSLISTTEITNKLSDTTKGVSTDEDEEDEDEEER